MIVVPIDFEKAFDKLDQAKLVKLSIMKGIPAHITRWYWAYMRQRRYCARVGADYSVSHGSSARFYQWTTLIQLIQNYAIRGTQYTCRGGS